MSNPPEQVMPGPITDAQRRAIFAAARAHGLSTDDVRAMTPAGSISKMSAVEACALLERLNSGTDYQRDRRERPRSPRRPKGVHAMVSEPQKRRIASLRIDLGWTHEKLAEFLAKRHYSHGGAMSKMLTTADGSEVIELLKGVQTRHQAARAAREDRS
jgi:hypothetical protein